MASQTPVARVRDKALELGVYLPLGAYARAREELADLNAPRFRKLYVDLVDRGQERLEPMSRLVRRRSKQVGSEVRERTDQVSRSARKTAERTAARAGAATDAVAPKLPRVATPKTAADLPIPSYDSLTAAEVVSATRGLTQSDLAKVYKYERANEGRATVLEALESRFVQLPIPTYDALNVDEIVGRLEGMSEEDLKTIRRYESETKARTTVLDKIDSLL